MSDKAVTKPAPSVTSIGTAILDTIASIFNLSFLKSTSPPNPPPTPTPAPPYKIITLSSNRLLSYTTFGAPYTPQTPTILYHHGYPSTRLEPIILHTAAQAHNIHIISFDRPGLGRSTCDENHKILYFVQTDLREFVDAVLPDGAKFVTLGCSGGAPYALATASEFKEQCVGCVVVAGIGVPPFSDEVWKEFKFLNRVMFGMTYYLPTRVVSFLMQGMVRQLQNATDEMLKKASKDVPPPDWSALFDPSNKIRTYGTPPNIYTFTQIIRECFPPSSTTTIPQWAHLLATHQAQLITDWEFEVSRETIRQPVVFYHGVLDRNVPVAVAKDMNRRIEGSELVLFEDEGHFSVGVNKGEEICEKVVELWEGRK
ncbi:hypothetical protein HDV00_006557 [Rhizophlyctis rosea]|nr:hypothetical protein HDV00_006557 [Rhizophlyctis rosea]